MKQIGWAVAGVVLGFVLGGIGPRLEVGNLQAERDRLQAELVVAQRKQSRRPGSLLPGMGQLFEAPAPRSDAPEEPDHTPEEPLVEDDPAYEEVGEPAVAPSGSPELALDEFDAAVDAQRIRSRQSRAALAEQADLSDDQLDQLDATIDNMNAALGEYSEELADLALSGDEPEAEDLLGLTHDVTGILYDAQTQVNDLVGESIDDVEPESRQIWNYVDLETFRGTVEDASGGQ